MLACGAVAIAAGPAAAQFEEAAQKLLKKHLPYRQYQATDPKLIGVLVGDPQPILSLEGRSGPIDELCFSYDGLSYRWTYVPTDDPNPMINNLSVPIGKDKNGGTMIFPKLHMASLKSLQPYGIKTPYCLVEMEVNTGAGSPENDSFAGTSFKILEGTKDYPLQVTKVINDLKKGYAGYVQEQQQKIDDALAKAQKSALKDQKPSGPREKADLMYVTWMTKDNTLQVRFLSRLQDGKYEFVQGGGGKKPFPLPVPIDPKLPPPPAKPGAAAAQPAAVQPAIAPANPAFLPPPPPPFFKIKVGNTFGVVYGRIYTVNKEGKITNTQNLEIETFTHTIAPPAGIGGGPVGGLPLQPLPPVKKEKE
jgi:hypothetical protein